jgi:hypothetical protein
MKRKFFLVAAIGFLLAYSTGYAQDDLVLRDPFASLGDKISVGALLDQAVLLPYPIVLKATLCSKDKVLAVLNDEIVKEGDRWNDFYVAKIEKEKVILEWKDKKFQILLDPLKNQDKEKK